MFDEAPMMAPVGKDIQSEIQEVVSLMQSHPSIAQSLLQQAKSLAKKADDQMQVCVRQLSGEILCTMEVDTNETVQAVKRKIQDISQTDINRQVLIFGNTELDSGTMNANKIQNGSELNLIIRQEAKAPPKRPPSPYFLFVQEKRQTVVTAGMDIGQAARIFTDMWQRLNPDAKKDFEDRAGVLLDQYFKDMEAYEASLPVERRKSKRMRTHESDDESECDCSHAFVLGVFSR
eukprot:gnl/TRDRNA2_/TRDRNA2_39809_c0_seq1.p1 gnl/TRDRNA2_/TRDRNA2_39809_c0~~gnl/TRDRNA2_/TRDRNA2_39809_c0_seq1.p1  ORF type:complete len:265 (+),score=37.94 gnl/TRDRNA2_/TRDRNA2_39809_c0_seq1:99-797(+)